MVCSCVEKTGSKLCPNDATLPPVSCRAPRLLFILNGEVSPTSDFLSLLVVFKVKKCYMRRCSLSLTRKGQEVKPTKTTTKVLSKLNVKNNKYIKIAAAIIIQLILVINP